jgi:hypothetical protein
MLFLLNIPIVFASLVVAIVAAYIVGTSNGAAGIVAIVAFLACWIGGNFLVYQMLEGRKR